MKKTWIATATMAALLGPVAYSAQRPAAKPTPGTTAAQQSKPATTAATATPAKPAGVKTHTLSGRIVSITDTSLIVSHGKEKKESTFMLHPDTKREGTLTAGEMVKVEYWNQGNDNMATLVQVQGLKTASRSKAPKSGY